MKRGVATLASSKLEKLKKSYHFGKQTAGRKSKSNFEYFLKLRI